MMLDYFYGQSGELFAYFRIPKALFQDSRFRQLSTDARTLYGILFDRMSLSAKNSWVDEHGRVLYHLHRPGGAGISLLRRAQGGQVVPGARTGRPHRTQTAWAGQTQLDLRQELFIWTAKNANTELCKQQFLCCRKCSSGAAKIAI